jgi:hypothetical protein
VSRCPRVAWYESLVGDARRSASYMAVKPLTLAETTTYVTRQWGPMLAALLAAYGGDTQLLHHVPRGRSPPMGPETRAVHKASTPPAPLRALGVFAVNARPPLDIFWITHVRCPSITRRSRAIDRGGIAMPRGHASPPSRRSNAARPRPALRPPRQLKKTRNYETGTRADSNRTT